MHFTFELAPVAPPALIGHPIWLIDGLKDAVNISRYKVVKSSALSTKAFKSLFMVGYIHDFKDTASYGMFQYDFVADFFVG